MKKTSKELLKFFGLEVGDIVEIAEGVNKKCKYEVKYFDDFAVEYRLVELGLEHDDTGRTIFILMEYEYEIIKPKQKHGDLCCGIEMKCGDCPLRLFDCGVECDTLYSTLNKLKKEGLDPEVYDIYKKKLDKEVSEDERVSKDS